jgi:hypothetical protein
VSQGLEGRNKLKTETLRFGVLQLRIKIRPEYISVRQHNSIANVLSDVVIFSIDESPLVVLLVAPRDASKGECTPLD